MKYFIRSHLIIYCKKVARKIVNLERKNEKKEGFAEVKIK